MKKLLSLKQQSLNQIVARLELGILFLFLCEADLVSQLVIQMNEFPWESHYSKARKSNLIRAENDRGGTVRRWTTFCMIWKNPEALIEGSYHSRPHDCSIGKSFSKNQRTVTKTHFSRLTFRMKARNGFWNAWHMPVLCSFGHKKQGYFRQARRGG
jgi:hypothetical protein